MTVQEVGWFGNSVPKLGTVVRSRVLDAGNRGLPLASESSSVESVAVGLFRLMSGS